MNAAIPGDFHFVLPSASVLIAAIPLIIILYLFLFHYRKRVIRMAISDEMAHIVVQARSTVNFWMQTALLCLCWLCGVIVLMQPEGYGKYLNGSGQHATKILDHEVVFLLDASASMGVTDTRTHVTRLSQAQEIIEAIVTQLSGEVVSLYAFTSDVTPLVPPTVDYSFVKVILQHVKINEGDVTGTTFTSVLTFIQNRFLAQPSVRKTTLILLSDGGDTSFDFNTPAQQKEIENKLVQILKPPPESHVRIFTVGMGSDVGREIPDVMNRGKPVQSKLNNRFLSAISAAAGGRNYIANQMTTAALADILIKAIESGDTASIKLTDVPQIDYQALYSTPLIIALLALAGVILIPEVAARRNGG